MTARLLYIQQPRQEAGKRIKPQYEAATWRMPQRKASTWQRFVIAIVSLLLLPLTASAITKQDADFCYRKGNYQQAITDYNTLLKQGVSADLYYNLGNAYYRSDNLARAILCYERASQLSPGDKDIKFNLQFANSKTIDRITPANEVIFVTWYKGLVNFTSVDNWARLSIVSIVLALILMLIYLFTSRINLRKTGFYGSIAFLVIFALSTLFAYQQKSALEERTGAIIMAPSVNVKQSPVNNAADAFVLHEGTRVDITDNGMKGWKGIRVGDGREGWIKADAIELI